MRNADSPTQVSTKTSKCLPQIECWGALLPATAGQRRRLDSAACVSAPEALLGTCNLESLGRVPHKWRQHWSGGEEIQRSKGGKLGVCAQPSGGALLWKLQVTCQSTFASAAPFASVAPMLIMHNSMHLMQNHGQWHLTSIPINSNQWPWQ